MASGMTVRLPENLKTEASAYAERAGVSLNALIGIALTYYLDHAKPDSTSRVETAHQAEQPPSPPETQPPAPESAPSKREARPQPVKRDTPKVGRNDPCPCGSGRKYKVCCGP